MEFLFGYDIGDARRRTAVRKLLRAVTPRWQQSFFDCRLSQGEADALFVELTGRMHPDADGLVLAAAHAPLDRHRLAPACHGFGGGVLWLE
jgi:CRISPR/Cas system-associated endoribonuclease Cas2